LLVELDEKSLREIGSFPFSRKKYATLIENLSEYKPSVIAFDFMFLDPSDPDSDLRLKESIRDFSNVVFGAGVNSS